MTRRKIMKSTFGYLAFHVFWLFSLTFLMPVLSKSITDGKDNLILVIPVFLYNFIFFYTYLYDVIHRNILEAKIVLLDSAVLRGYGEELGRVIEGTTAGRRGRTLMLKPRRKTDFIFRVRGRVPGQDYVPGRGMGSIAIIKYLKHSRMILEWTAVEDKEYRMLRFSKKDKDYILFPPQFGKNTLGINCYRYTREEAEEQIKEGEIKHAPCSFAEIAGRVIGAVLYGSAMGTILYFLQSYAYSTL